MKDSLTKKYLDQYWRNRLFKLIFLLILISIVVLFSVNSVYPWWRDIELFVDMVASLIVVYFSLNIFYYEGIIYVIYGKRVEDGLFSKFKNLSNSIKRKFFILFFVIFLLLLGLRILGKDLLLDCLSDDNYNLNLTDSYYYDGNEATSE